MGEAGPTALAAARREVRSPAAYAPANSISTHALPISAHIFGIERQGACEKIASPRQTIEIDSLMNQRHALKIEVY
jgi:hypothetical protein